QWSRTVVRERPFGNERTANARSLSTGQNECLTCHANVRTMRTMTDPQAVAPTAGQRTHTTKVTARQRQVLDFIESEMRERGYPPSVRETGEAIGLTSPSTVHSHLNTL